MAKKPRQIFVFLDINGTWRQPLLDWLDPHEIKPDYAKTGVRELNRLGRQFAQSKTVLLVPVCTSTLRVSSSRREIQALMTRHGMDPRRLRLPKQFATPDLGEQKTRGDEVRRYCQINRVKHAMIFDDDETYYPSQNRIRVSHAHGLSRPDVVKALAAARRSMGRKAPRA